MAQNLEMVNIVGSGRINSELDLGALCEDLDLESVYIKGPGLYLKFDKSGPIIVIARSGKYFITGTDSCEVLEENRRKCLDLFVKMGILNRPNDEDFSIKNIVYTSTLNRSIDLEILAIHIGFENMEYEPEQFPGLIFRPPETNSVALIFATGKIVITGVIERNEAEITLNKIFDILDQI